MNDFINYLCDYAVFNIAILCFGIGYIIKHYINGIPNKFIPLILAGCGIFINIAFNGFEVSTLNIIVGAGSGVAATGSFEAVRNLKEKK